MNLLRRLGWYDVKVDKADLQRLAVLFAVCVLTALLVADYSRTPSETLMVGDVAPRTVKANQTFQYIDEADRDRRAQQARKTTPPVYVHLPIGQRVSARIRIAFEQGRAAVIARRDQGTEVEAGAADGIGPEGGEQAGLLDAAAMAAVASEFRSNLGVHVADEDVAALATAEFSAEAEKLALTILTDAMRGYVIEDRSSLPSDRRTIRVIERRAGEQQSDELDESDYEEYRTVREVREQARFALLESKVDTAWASSVGTVTRALVRANLTFDPIETRLRADRTAASVPVAAITVKRGTTLFRQGDVLTQDDILRYTALQDGRPTQSIGVELIAIGFFLLLLFVSLYHFGASYLQDFSTGLREVAAVGGLVVLTAFLARLVVGTSPGVAQFVGLEADPASVWFVVPVAGAAMLARLLVGVAWTVVFSVAASAVCGLVMELEALMVVFFVLSSIAAAGAVEHTRERMAVLRAGVFTGVVNAATVLLIHFVQLFVGDGEISLATTMRPFWSMAFAFGGGMLSAFLVLGLIPLMEAAGFVTDYRLMELANLNHPLLRQLMLRAPGSYHHSIVVGSLSEAACEAVGANALQARVAAYFHDIGKGLRPQFFVENQRDGVNRHDTLDAKTSAQLIISHVTDGGRMAREHKLPQPIVDNIYMHHGTGLLQYFYRKAQASVDDPTTIDVAAFRYPGPKPSTREAGIIMLADKVEAATRTIRHPTERNIRAMITSIINSVMADGQFDECPLTFQEIHTVAETFVMVLMGIHHSRIEYPDTKDISAGTSAAEATGTITLEIGPPPTTPTPEQPKSAAAMHEEEPEEPEDLEEPEVTSEEPVPADDDDHTDYEALEHLPHAGR